MALKGKKNHGHKIGNN